MEPIVPIIAAAAVAGVIAAAIRSGRSAKYAQLGSIACVTCGSEDIEEHSATDYACRVCDYDTTIEETGERGRLGALCRELGMLVARLESAEADFDASKMRGSRSTKTGPYPGIYLEASNQAGEVGELIAEHDILGPELGARIRPLFDLPAPPTGSDLLVGFAFNGTADRARRQVQPVTSALRSARLRYIDQYRIAQGK